MYNGCFKNLDTPEKTYWFGFIVGDGYIGKYRREVYRLGIMLIDYEHLIKLALFLGYSKNRVKSQKCGYYTLQINCKELYFDLLNLGLTPRKSNTVDSNIIPKKYQWDFIRGLIDADGCICIGNINSDKSLRVGVSIVGNYPLLEEIKKIIDAGGNLIKRIRPTGNSYELSYSGRGKIETILNKIYYYKPYLERKYSKYLQLKEYNKIHGKRIRRIRKWDIYIDTLGYVKSNCLYCGEEFLARGFDYPNHSNFCCRSHKTYINGKLRKGMIILPIMDCQLNGKDGYKYGESGHCYTYEKDDELGRKNAKRKAIIQGTAIAHNSGEKLEISKEDYEDIDEERIVMKLEPETIIKNEEDHTLFGWAYVAKRLDGSQVVDHSEEFVKEENFADLEIATYFFNIAYRQADIRHDCIAKGYLIDSMVFTKEKVEAMRKSGHLQGDISLGVWMGYWFPEDEDWNTIKAMKSPMFSLYGAAIKEFVEEV